MRNYRDETSTEFCTSTGLRFLARGFLVENISLGKFKYANVNFVIFFSRNFNHLMLITLFDKNLLSNKLEKI
jgi:hypothetical protein